MTNESGNANLSLGIRLRLGRSLALPTSDPRPPISDLRPLAIIPIEDEDEDENENENERPPTPDH